MNVGIAVHRFDRSEGTGRYTVELVERLAGEVHVTLYAARIAADVPRGVDVVRVPAVTATAYTAILSYPLALRSVRRRHDLFHAQGWVTGRAHVVTAHIVLAAWRRAARRAAVRSATGERLLGGFVAAREGRVMRRAAAVIAPSRMAAADLATCYGRRDRVHVIPHGFPVVDPLPDPVRARAALGLPSDSVVALFVGDVRKGLDAAARAVAAVPGVVLAVVSHSPPGRVREAASAAALGDRLITVGPLDDAGRAYAAADLLLHPTIYDTFGLVVAESMAYGVPPIVTARAGIAELIAHGRSGWIVDDAEPDALTGALTTLSADAALRGRLAREARAVARARPWDQVAVETLRVYREVAP